ncbi:MAG: class I SAM-dependent methyltransferase [Promethearchaeota archaeon]
MSKKLSDYHPTERFSTREANYLKYRPSYPKILLQELQNHGYLTDSCVVGDIGAGTGKFTEILLDRGLEVYAVEPNSDMRQTAEDLFHGRVNFHSVDGTAECTELADHLLDLVVIAQAFHWFEYTASIREFQRILKLNGVLVFVWNIRNSKSSAFLSEYEEILLNYCLKYRSSPHRHLDEGELERAIRVDSFHHFTCSYVQKLNYTGFEGRVFSTSYTPHPQDAHFKPLCDALRRLFEKYQEDGQIQFEYTTQMYFGPINRNKIK